jgi:hypothetical protein
MKTKIVALLFALAGMFITSCEKHKWSETNQLFKSHGEHGEAHGTTAEHGDAGTPAEKAKSHEAAKHE